MSIVSESLVHEILFESCYCCYKLNELDNYVVCKFQIDGKSFSITGAGTCMTTPTLACSHANMTEDLPENKKYIFLREN